MFGIGKKNKSDSKKNTTGKERQFISELSYNVRNPLNTICGITEIARKNIEGDYDRETLLSYMEILEDAATELQQTVDHYFECYEAGSYSGVYTENSEETDKSVLKNLRVMVVEDSSVSQLIAKERLENSGAIVTLCDGGKDAVERFKQSITGTYDVIFMDINMPEMDGYEATDAIRSCDHPQAKIIPIIAMTAEALTEDIQKALKVGMNAHVSKPINDEKIVSAIKAVL
ncbi:MAG: response regulator [Lachnospiraceae bacterium]|nr:response regulator [Lachnospiraceae bacterium]